MKPVTREWLKAADDDIVAMRRMLDVEEITNIVAFHAQQCIEKSFKAIIEEHQTGLIRTHNIESLYAKVKDIMGEIDEQIIDRLDKLYIEARYPGEMGLMPYGKTSKEDAKRYFCEALRIKEQVEALLT